MRDATRWLVMIAVLAWGFAPRPVSADATIYYYRDERGVFHFSNIPDSPRYQVYAVFRGYGGYGDMTPGEILAVARRHSATHGVDAALVRAVIEVESGYDVDAVSSAGAEGLMQIMPETQADLGVKEAFDPEENIEAGVRYLKHLLDRFGSVELALAAYNAGPGTVERYGGVPPYKETRQYVHKVLGRWNKR